MKYISVILLFLSTYSYSQIEFKSSFREKIDPIEINLKNFLSDNKFIIVCTDNKLLILIEKEKKYLELQYVYINDEYKLDQIDIIDNKILKEVFNAKNYLPGYIDIESDFYKDGVKDSFGDVCYLSFNLGINNRYCEYVLSTAIKPIPMNYKVYGYISLTFLGIQPNHD